MRAPVALGLVVALATPGVAFAQRAGENAVAAADDAFGMSVGLEQTGIYSEADTRGFSPSKAGNARMDGVYYDPVGALSARLRSGNTIRVGFAAEEYPFQAPTGIVEYRLRGFPTETGASVGYNFMAFGGFIRELDLRLPIAGDRCLRRRRGAVGPQEQRRREQRGLGRDRQGHRAAGRDRDCAVRLLFGLHAELCAPDRGGHRCLPAENPQGTALSGPGLGQGHYANHQFGGVVKAAITDRLSMRGGLFHAVGDKQRNYSEIFPILAPSGLASHVFISDPEQALHSTSGEVQVVYRIVDGRWQHRLIAGFRARNRLTQTGGSDVRDFGLVVYGERDPEPEPVFSYSRVNVGRVKQSAAMIGYVGKIEGVGTLNLGVQKARYRATFRRGSDGLVTPARDDPWLYNATIGADVSPALSLYAGTQKGLEDSGAAPENATNRNEQLPATRTRQYEAGARWKFHGGQIVVSAFQITKPYFAFDGTRAFTQVGNVRHRGVEGSLSGHFGPRFNLLAGAVLMQPRVTSELADVGKRPTGTPSVYVKMDANYRTDIFGGLTPTAALTYTGKRVAGSRPQAALGGRQLMVDGFASLDLGLRQSFMVGKIPASFRFLAYNVFDAASWKVVAANSIYMEERRRYNLSLTADF